MHPKKQEALNLFRQLENLDAGDSIFEAGRIVARLESNHKLPHLIGQEAYQAAMPGNGKTEMTEAIPEKVCQKVYSALLLDIPEPIKPARASVDEDKIISEWERETTTPILKAVEMTVNKSNTKRAIKAVDIAFRQPLSLLEMIDTGWGFGKFAGTHENKDYEVWAHIGAGLCQCECMDWKRHAPKNGEGENEASTHWCKHAMALMILMERYEALQARIANPPTPDDESAFWESLEHDADKFFTPNHYPTEENLQ